MSRTGSAIRPRRRTAAVLAAAGLLLGAAVLEPGPGGGVARDVRRWAAVLLAQPGGEGSARTGPAAPVRAETVAQADDAEGRGSARGEGGAPRTPPAQEERRPLASPEGELCDAIATRALAAAVPGIEKWQAIAEEGRTILGFGGQASRLLRRTLAGYDRQVRKEGADGHPDCAAARARAERALQGQLRAIFALQRLTVEQAVKTRLKKALLRRMRQKKRELEVKERVQMLKMSVKEFDARVRELQPTFVQANEAGREAAVKALGELAAGIGQTPEAKELQNNWKMEQLRKSSGGRRRGVSMSLAPGLRLMLRPSGFGNFQLNTNLKVGSPHNPSELSMGVLNDGNVIDVYNGKPKPPLIKLQPTIGMDFALS